ncbi:MAG: hypothetical protein QXH21_07995 [Ignisphaera sp.]
MGYRVRFGNDYISVSSKELEEEVKRLISFVTHGEYMDIRDALRIVHYLKKYKSKSPAAVALVKMAEERILEILKETGESLW